MRARGVGYRISVSSSTTKRPRRPVSARVKRQRNLQQRQTVIFGGITIALVLLLLLSLATWTGVIGSPFNRGFSAKEDPNAGVIPCIAPGTPPVPLNEISANVYNATPRTGLAGSVGSRLTELEVQVGNETNWGGAVPPEAARIYASYDGIPAAYTMARLIPGAIVMLDETNTTEVIDIVLSTDFTDVESNEAIAALGETPLESHAQCVEVKQDAGTN